MAESQNSKQNVQAPQAGQTVIVNAIPGQDIVLEAAFDQAEVKMDGGNVVFEFANGGQVVLDFTDLGDAQAPNVVMPDGTVLDMQEFLASLGEKDVEPAAGPDGGATGSGGVGEYQDDAGDVIGGVDKLGVLGPRAFSDFSVESLEANDSIPSLLGPDGVLVEDEALFPEGNNEDDGGVGSVTGTIVDNVDWGADGFGEVTGFNVGGVSFAAGSTVYWGQDGTFLGTSGEGAAASLLVGVDGAYTFTVLDNLLLGEGVQGEQINLLGTVQIIGADTTGDTVEIPLALSVQDDVPEIDVFVRTGQGYIDGNVAGGTIFGGTEGQDGTTSSVDSWFFKVNSGGLVTIDTLAMERTDSGGYIDINGDGDIKFFDPYIYVFKDNGGVPGDLVASNDDSYNTYGDGSIHHYDSYLSFDNLPAGNYILVIGAFSLTEAEARDGVNEDDYYPRGLGEGGVDVPASSAGYKITFGGDVTITGGTNVGSGYASPSLVTQDADTIGDGFDTATASFAGLFGADVRMGADDPGTGPIWEFKLSLTSEDGFTGLTSGKEAIVLSFDEETGTVIGSTDRGTIFTIEVNAETGEVKLTQFAQIDHLQEDLDGVNDNSFLGLPEGSIALTAKATVVDEDGDIASDSETIDITGSIGFDDDVPKLTGNSVLVKVDEGDILTSWSQGTTPNDGNADGSYTDNPYYADSGPAYVSGTLANVVSFGGDGKGSFSFTTDAVAQLTALHLYSKESALPENGQALTYSTSTSNQGNVLILRAFEPDTVGRGDTSNLVFELKLNKLTGDYEFRLFDELIHVAPESGADTNIELRSGPDGAFVSSINFGKIIQAIDSDNDSVTLDGAFNIQVLDDIPKVDVDYVKPYVKVVHDETVGYQNDDTSSGYVAHLFSSLPMSIKGNDEDLAGSSAIGFARSGEAIVKVDGDDTQIGADAPALVSEYSFELLNAASGILDSGLKTTEGEAIILSKDSEGRIVGTVAPGGEHAGKIAFALAINESNGEVFVAQYLSLKHPNANSHDEAVDLSGKLAVRYTVTDSDGDTVFDQLPMGSQIQFEDDGPKAFANNLVVLDDDALSGNPGGIHDNDDSVNASGTLGHSFGLDGGSISWLTTGNPEGFTYEAGDDNSLFVKQGGTLVLTLTLDPATGAYTVIQNAPIMHESGNFENNQFFNIGYQVKDGDGDTAPGSLLIKVDDDTPVIVTQNAHILSESFESFAEISGNDWTVVGEGGGEIVGNGGIKWTVNSAGIEIQSGNVGGSSASDGQVHAELDAHDSQGDGGTTLTTLSATVELPSSEVVLTFDYRPRPDDKGDSGMTVTLGGVKVTIESDAAGNITVTAGDGVTVGPVGSPVQGWTPISLTFSGLVTGSADLVVSGLSDQVDGDTLGAYLDNIKMHADQAVLTVDETTLGVDATADLSGFFAGKFGADGPHELKYALGLDDEYDPDSLALVDTESGENVILSVNGDGVVEGRTEDGDELVFKVLVNEGSGVVKLDQLRAVEHSDPDKADEPFNLEGMVKLTATITDADNDSASASIDVKLVFHDDGPTAENVSKSFVEQVPVYVSGFQAGFVNPTVESDATLLEKNYDSDSYPDALFWGGNERNGSGYKFVDNESLRGFSGNLAGSTFVLGTFSHINKSINTGSLESVGLVLKFMVNGQMVEHTIVLQHDETPNNGSGAEDEISLVGTTLNKTFSIDGQNFTLHIEGFADLLGNPVGTTISTEEGKTSSFQLVASISEVPASVIDGSITPDYGADGQGEVIWAGDYDGEIKAYVVENEYGTFFGRSDGSYKFVQNSFDANEAVKMDFGYTVVDGDGDKDGAVLSLTLTDASEVVAYDNYAQAVLEAVTVPGAVLTNTLANFSATNNTSNNPWVFDLTNDSYPAGNETTVVNGDQNVLASIAGNSNKWIVSTIEGNYSDAVVTGGRLLLEDSDGSWSGSAQLLTPIFTVGSTGLSTLSFTYQRGNVHSADNATWKLFKLNTANSTWEAVQGANSSGTFPDNTTPGEVTTGVLSAGQYRVFFSVDDGKSSNGYSQIYLDDIKLVTVLPDTTKVEAVVATGNVLTDDMNLISSSDPWNSVDDKGSEGASLWVFNGSEYIQVPTAGTTVVGAYGSLFIENDGSYTYTPVHNLDNVGEQDVFTYKLVQPDGDSDTANLVIGIESTPHVSPSPIIDPVDGELVGTNGDDVILGSFDDDVLKGNDGDDHLEGRDGNDTLEGGLGDDIIIGGAGDDHMTGGAGRDTFAYNAGDLDDVLNGDTITDFQLGDGGDTLDLSGLLNGAPGGLDKFLDFEVTNINAGTAQVQIHVDTTGHENFNGATPLATIEVSGFAAGDNADVIEAMLKSQIDV